MEVAPCEPFSECSRLTRVALHRGSPSVHRLAQPESALHDDPITYPQLRLEFDMLAACLTQRGIQVEDVKHAAGDPPLAAFNLFYLRDVAAITPFGHVMARMGAAIRRDEPPIFRRRLLQLGLPVIGEILEPGTLEGADVLWLSPTTAIVGVGRRTNPAGALQLQTLLAPHGVKVILVPAPSHSLHLLGSLQIVSPYRALLRGETVAVEIKDVLTGEGFHQFDVAESDLVDEPHAMNLVVLSPGCVLMRSGCARMRRRLDAEGLETFECIADELVRGGGGFGCAVGILARDGMNVAVAAAADERAEAD